MKNVFTATFMKYKLLTLHMFTNAAQKQLTNQIKITTFIFFYSVILVYLCLLLVFQDCVIKMCDIIIFYT